MSDHHQAPERRRVARTSLTTVCPTRFEVAGEVHHALMTDLSPLGAQLRLAERAEPPALGPGHELDLTVTTPYGASRCRGIVRWTRTLEDGLDYFGVEFSVLSEDPQDPLRAYLDSPF